MEFDYVEEEQVVAETVVEKLPNMDLPRWRFLLSLPQYAHKEEIKQKLMNAIKENNMTPYYEDVCTQFNWPRDENLIQTMRKNNEATKKELEDKTEDAVKNLGSTEVRESYLKRAEFFTRIGDKEQALSMYRQTLEQTVGLGSKLDIALTNIRIGIFYDDMELVKRSIERAKSMIEEGGDWDRRNRLKVYEAYYLMRIRQFLPAANLFLDTLSTFTSEELFDYKTFIFYTIITTIVSLDRVTLNKRILDSPEIKSVIHDLGALGTLITSYYNGDYGTFFKSMVQVLDEHIALDLAVHRHARYWAREMRVRAYAQFLESYKTVNLSSMASLFSVTGEFLDKELSRFIATGRLNCKVDKVGGVIETNRPDTKNAQYQSVIKQGDHLLNRIQKLSRVINL
jgi:26S proteasome regulatory subunit N7